MSIVKCPPSGNMKVRSSVFATLILISEVIGITLFLRGFFPVPVKSSVASKNRLSDLPAEPLTGEPPSSPLPPAGMLRLLTGFPSEVVQSDPHKREHITSGYV